MKAVELTVKLWVTDDMSLSATRTLFDRIVQHGLAQIKAGGTGPHNDWHEVHCTKSKTQPGAAE